MGKKSTQDLVYIPPEIEIVKSTDILVKLGPVVSCSGFGGAQTGC